WLLVWAPHNLLLALVGFWLQSLPLSLVVSPQQAVSVALSAQFLARALSQSLKTLSFCLASRLTGKALSLERLSSWLFRSTPYLVVICDGKHSELSAIGTSLGPGRTKNE